MFFVNLSLGEFIGLLGAVAGIVTALYLLDRAKHKKVVSTLRFWVDARRVEERQRRKRVREPWSLLLQLLSPCLFSLQHICSYACEPFLLRIILDHTLGR